MGRKSALAVGDQGLGHHIVAVDHTLNFFGVDVLAARTDNGSRGAAFDVEPAVLVQLAEILCQKPAVLGEGWLLR